MRPVQFYLRVADMKKANPQPADGQAICQLKAYIAEHGAAIVIRGREYRFENVRTGNALRTLADAHTARASYLAMQTLGTVIGRPGAESWSIMRTSGGGSCVAMFAIHNGKLLEIS